MTYCKTMLSASILATLMLAGTAFAGDSQPDKQPQPVPQGTAQNVNPNDQQDAAQKNASKSGKKTIQELQAVQVVGFGQACSNRCR